MVCKYCGRYINIPPEVGEEVDLEDYIGNGIHCPGCHTGLGVDDLITIEEYQARSLVGDEVAERAMEWIDDWEYVLELVEDIARAIEQKKGVA